ncbi:MAG: metalloregulator ArsR/SmtB family transcription factor, partial [Bacteroidota bacterium]
IQMGLTKTDAYTDRQRYLADICKVLGHPARIAILEQLFRVDCCICRDFTEEINLSQPTISRHLKELKAAGIIKGTVEGVSVSYCINPERWQEIRAVLNGLFDRFGEGNSGCC